MLDFLHQRRQLDLDAENLVAEGIHAQLVGDRKRLPVIFDRIFGGEGDVGVVQCSSEFLGDGFREFVEGADYVAIVDVVGVDETAGADEDAVSCISLSSDVSNGDGIYETAASETEYGYCLNNSLAAARVDLCLIPG